MRRKKNPSENFYVYVDRTGDEGLTFYVGKGNPGRVKEFRRNKHHNNVIRKHGIMRELTFATSLEDLALGVEMQLISEHHTFVDDPQYNGIGCNYTPGGEGHTPTKEERKRISERKKKWWAEHPEEKEKRSREMSERMKGTHHTEEWKRNHSKKMSNRLDHQWKNKEFTLEYRANLSKAAKGRMPWNTGKDFPQKFRPIEVTDKNGIRIFKSRKEATQVLSQESGILENTFKHRFVIKTLEYKGYKFNYDVKESNG